MTTGSQERKAEIIESVAERVRDRIDPTLAQAPELFVRQFYAHVAPGDLVDDTPDNLFGAALGLWQLGHQRDPQTPRIRVYTPRIEENGWVSSHTVVEVVTDDMPFLLESITAYLNQHDATVHLVIHPILEVERDEEGTLVELHRDFENGAGALRESFMHIQVSEQPKERHEDLAAGVARILVDVRAAVEDFPAMNARCAEITAALETSDAQREEEVAFLRWLMDDHFTFLGFRSYTFEGDLARVEAGSGLGVLRDALAEAFQGLLTGGYRPVETQHVDALRVTKANRHSTVHRPVRLDTVGIQRKDAAGNVIGEHLFIGLFTSSAYERGPQEIPILRKKVEYCLAKAEFHKDSYNYKTLVHILRTYPRDELWQITALELYDISLGILHLQERQQIAFFPRRDPFGRFVSCLVYVPREKYDTALRLRFQAILEQAYKGTVDGYFTQMSDAAHARLHLIVRLHPDASTNGEPDTQEIQNQLIEAGRSWGDRLQDALILARGEQAGISTYRRFADAFPSSYRDNSSADVAIHDIEGLEEAMGPNGFALNLYRPAEAEENEVHFKLYVAGATAALSDVLPVLENMGLKVMREVPYKVRAKDGPDVWIRDFELLSRSGEGIDLHEVRAGFHDAIYQIWAGHIEDDGFNQLILSAGLTAREVSILRAYCRYLRQATIPFSQDYMERTLGKSPNIVRWLVELFDVRFNPDRNGDRDEKARTLAAKIEAALESITNLDEDRILRSFLTILEATLRTNYYQKTTFGDPKSYISFKLDSQSIPGLPLPRPLVEIWVYSPRVEAVHLRGGRVARGGIRWSDRLEDFRTEVLGLMKAQMVKNTVIVPVGSKGGFVVKRPPAEWAELKEEVVACYRTMMSGLLDVTDNLQGAEVLPPPAVVRRDEDDPYLVVAADKGTATFSDIANAVSVEYGFWLDDAFASGGSAGYDHKKMGITARGAWESVKRHFREMGKNIQEEEFTVVGVGDMAGDVFGNGMLLSRHIRLVAAFNHMHIFIDPTPDAASSFDERLRLFQTPNTTWDDYDRSLISEGGGVWSRSLKAIEVTPQMQSLFGIEGDKITPNELIHLLLQADVELLWFGGIGTYVRATHESDVAVGDHANDTLRVMAPQLKAKVVGEGANLALTHAARVEFARRGGRLYTDFIDNSAGVDCSDHEVNIKILLGEVERDGDITRKQRDELLESMTDEVGHLVLRDNYLQTQSLAVTRQLGVHLLDRLGRFMRRLEKEGRLDRKLESLPDDEELAERFARGECLTRPELSTLLSYSKMQLYEELLHGDLPDDPCLVPDLVAYFPTPLQETYRGAIAGHRLRREIIATVITNEMINRGGISFVHEVREKTGHSASDVARAYLVARSIFGIEDIWADVEALDNKIPASAQSTLLMECGRAIDRATVWFLRNSELPMQVSSLIEEYGEGIRELMPVLDKMLGEDQKQTLAARIGNFRSEGAPDEIAGRVGRLLFVVAACDIVLLARELDLEVPYVAQMYFRVGTRFGFNWLRRAAFRLPSDTAWDKLAVTALVDDLEGHQRNLARRILSTPDTGRSADEAIDAWAGTRGPLVTRAEQLVAELQSNANLDFPMLAVAGRQFNAMIG